MSEPATPARAESASAGFSTDATTFRTPEDVRDQLREAAADLEIDDLTLIGNGLDFVVYRAARSRLGPLALRAVPFRVHTQL